MCIYFLYHKYLSGDLTCSQHLGAIQVLLKTMGVGVCQIYQIKHYEGVRFNVTSVTRGWVGVKYPEKSIT